MGIVVPIQDVLDKNNEADEQTPDHKTISDEDLVLRARDRDRWAQNTLARRYVHEIARVVARLMGRHDEVDDLVQDTFLAAFEQLDTIQNPAAFRGWILRIAIYKTRNAIRKHRLLRTLGLDRGTQDATLEELAHDHLSPDIRIELAAVDEVLTKLPVNQRIAWLLRYIEGHTVRDVSDLCGCSLATAKRRLAKAHQRVLQVVDTEVLSRGC